MDNEKNSEKDAYDIDDLDDALLLAACFEAEKEHDEIERKANGSLSINPASPQSLVDSNFIHTGDTRKGNLENDFGCRQRSPSIKITKCQCLKNRRQLYVF